MFVLYWRGERGWGYHSDIPPEICIASIAFPADSCWMVPKPPGDWDC